ncbi:MAG: hypothetical protein AAFZ10_04255 [Pseudomonadota bacterium]
MSTVVKIKGVLKLGVAALFGLFFGWCSASILGAAADHDLKINLFVLAFLAVISLPGLALLLPITSLQKRWQSAHFEKQSPEEQERITAESKHVVSVLWMAFLLGAAAYLFFGSSRPSGLV